MTAPAIDPRLVLAQAKADAARAQFSRTIGTIQHRVSPNVIAHDMADTIKERSIEALTEAVDTAKRRPVQVGIGVTLAGLFFARGAIAKALRHATSAKSKS